MSSCIMIHVGNESDISYRIKQCSLVKRQSMARRQAKEAATHYGQYFVGSGLRHGRTSRESCRRRLRCRRDRRKGPF